MTDAPEFDDHFRDQLTDLLRWRRDVRRFMTTPLPAGLLESLLAQACLAPSVGNSQPWRFVVVEDPNRRSLVRENFISCNAAATTAYDGDDADLYGQLKLEGLEQAPVHLAVFAEREPEEGRGLGRQTMAETVSYSAVGAIHTLWLAARAQGVGLGWLSILDPDVVTDILDVPESWAFIAYLCLGYPVEEHLDPELVRHGWQDRLPLEDFTLQR
ncbi:MAG: 5,6-dimethylbenzimidazole synthase [Rhodospirillaceae bacterium]|jgi:5,6-dimethylbenzimidazole synthase|nr:5,6-dimethylbenzimidazole synthase [Rhodospirillaceae bacterium]MBT5457956.1 5,6-dimethylbenzimidazole synthase [Rhodospirillaceae bacterium]